MPAISLSRLPLLGSAGEVRRAMHVSTHLIIIITPQTDAAPPSPATFYTLTERGLAGLQAASEELHRMFLLATCYVLHHLEDRDLVAKFNVPEPLWPGRGRSPSLGIRKRWHGGMDDFTE